MKIYQEFNNSLLERPSDNAPKIKERVKQIVEAIRQKGDSALFELTEQIDGYTLSPESVLVTPSEIESATATLSDEFKRAIEQARSNIEIFHRAQLRQDVHVSPMEGVSLSQRRVAIPRVGLYIPSGSAPLFSTVLMCAVPAMVAGCQEVVMASPANSEGKIAPEILYTASVCGITEIYKIGGAMAIAAMAWGTQSVGKVDKIFGPGNRYVTYAKQLVSVDAAAIDMPAGPSEVMVLADDSCNSSFVAADLLSQLEHGADSQAIAIVASESIAKQIYDDTLSQMAQLDRQEILKESIKNCLIIVEPNIDRMIQIANDYGAEHLIISLHDADNIALKITNAGSIFIGNYSPESVGDYASGTNHTLPTGGWARSYSGVNVDSFSKYITYQKLSREGLTALEKTVTTMAQCEGLAAHAKAVTIRTQAK